jgi:hypothetical protein
MERAQVVTETVAGSGYDRFAEVMLEVNPAFAAATSGETLTESHPGLAQYGAFPVRQNFSLN